MKTGPINVETLAKVNDLHYSQALSDELYGLVKQGKMEESQYLALCAQVAQQRYSDEGAFNQVIRNSNWVPRSLMNSFLTEALEEKVDGVSKNDIIKNSVDNYINNPSDENRQAVVNKMIEFFPDKLIESSMPFYNRYLNTIKDINLQREKTGEKIEEPERKSDFVGALMFMVESHFLKGNTDQKTKEAFIKIRQGDRSELIERFDVARSRLGNDYNPIVDPKTLSVIEENKNLIENKAYLNKIKSESENIKSSRENTKAENKKVGTEFKFSNEVDLEAQKIILNTLKEISDSKKIDEKSPKEEYQKAVNEAVDKKLEINLGGYFQKIIIDKEMPIEMKKTSLEVGLKAFKSKNSDFYKRMEKYKNMLSVGKAQEKVIEDIFNKKTDEFTLQDRNEFRALMERSIQINFDNKLVMGAMEKLHENEHASENINFIKEMNQLETLTKEMQAKKIEEIKSQYLEVGAPNQINIDEGMRTKILSSSSPEDFVEKAKEAVDECKRLALTKSTKLTGYLESPNPLHAALYSNVEPRELDPILQAYKKSNLNINEKDLFGHSPLEIAGKKGNRLAVGALLSEGATTTEYKRNLGTKIGDAFKGLFKGGIKGFMTGFREPPPRTLNEILSTKSGNTTLELTNNIVNKNKVADFSEGINQIKKSLENNKDVVDNLSLNLMKEVSAKLDELKNKGEVNSPNVEMLTKIGILLDESSVNKESGIDLTGSGIELEINEIINNMSDQHGEESIEEAKQLAITLLDKVHEPLKQALSKLHTDDEKIQDLHTTGNPPITRSYDQTNRDSKGLRDSVRTGITKELTSPQDDQKSSVNTRMKNN